jgi:hypothetical protein
MRGSASVRVRNFSVGSVRSQSADSEKSADLRPQADASAVRTSLMRTTQTGNVTVTIIQWRRQDLELGGKHGERGARAYMGVWR